jgi:LysM repeat protein
MKRGIFIIVSVLAFTSCKTSKNILAGTGSSGNGETVKTAPPAKKYPAALDYIERFQGIAVREMNKYGIPASITLAQGLLESGNGNSSLAVQANNHFGIKCNSDWKGKTIYKDDDAVGECFRVYSSPEESYRDHSEFLLRKRYAALFQLDRNDYTGWAHGLKKAGYATNPKYAELLISLIERYDLQQYDRGETVLAKEKREEKVMEEVISNIPDEKKIAEAKPPVSIKIYEVKAGETLYAISRKFGLTAEELRTLNGLESEKLNIGQLLLVSK